MYRIGQSTDIHRLVEGRDLILGGVKIPFEKGLLGHSDADVLYHAICESIIGALSLGDIGKFFPDNDERYKGKESSFFMDEAYKMMDLKGYEIANVDSLIICEKPKMRPYIDTMRQNIATLLHTDIDNVNVKATTNEKLDAIGRGEAIRAYSTCLLRKKG